MPPGGTRDIVECGEKLRTKRQLEEREMPSAVLRSSARETLPVDQ